MRLIFRDLLKIIIVIQTTACINFPLTKSRQTCLYLYPGSYQLQYVISGHSEKEVRLVIKQDTLTILNVTGKSQYQTEFNITNDQASVCFSALDNLAKSVSVDFFRTDDPLRGYIQDEKKLKIHEQAYKSFQQMQKVYRDQHFFIERNFIHSILLRQTEVIVVFFMFVKIIVAFICSFFQLYFVKRILQDSFSPLPSSQSSQTFN